MASYIRSPTGQAGINDSTTGAQKSYTCAAGDYFEIDYWCSTEATFDFLRIRVNGSAEGTTYSGTQTGTHTTGATGSGSISIRVEYVKDGSDAGGSDYVRVSEIRRFNSSNALQETEAFAGFPTGWSFTDDNANVTGDWTYESDGVSGTLAQTTPLATLAADGVIPVVGTAAASTTLPTLWATDTEREVALLESGAVALLETEAPSHLEAEDDGGGAITGTVAQTTPLATLAASGSPVTTGTSAATAPVPTVAASGSPIITGTAAATAPVPTLEATDEDSDEWQKEAASSLQDRSVKNGHAAIFDRNPAGRPDTIIAAVGGNGDAPRLLYGLVEQASALSVFSLTNPALTLGTQYPCIFQDTVNYDLHLVANDGETNVAYWRVRPTWDGSGNVTGFTQITALLLTQYLYHSSILEVVDGSGNKRLMVLGLKDSDTDEVTHYGMVTTVAAGTLPTATTHFTSFAGSAGALTDLGVTWTTASEGGTADPWEYEANCSAVQHGTSKVVEYVAACGHHGTRSARFTRIPISTSGTSWTAGTAVFGASATTGGVHAAVDGDDVWIVHHTSGGHTVAITKVDGSGTQTTPLSSPSPGSPIAGDENAGIAVYDGSVAVLMYEDGELFGRVHDGSSWSAALSFPDPGFYWHQGAYGVGIKGGQAWIAGVSAPQSDEVVVTALAFADEMTALDGTLAQTTPVATLAASGSPIVAGSASIATTLATLTGSGSTSVSGALGATTTTATLAASGFSTVGGALSATTPLATLAASGGLVGIVVGTLSASTDVPTLSATGSRVLAFQVVNKALARIGVSTFIASMDEDSVEAELASSLYDGALETVLATFNWPFATKRQELVELEDVTRTGWLHTFEYPSDCVSPRYVYAGTRTPMPEFRIPFALETPDDGDLPIICCDEAGPTLIYTCRVTNPALWTQPFVDAFAWFLAAEMALPLAVRSDLRDQATRMWEAMKDHAAAIAMGEEHETLPTTTAVSIRGFNGN